MKKTKATAKKLPSLITAVEAGDVEAVRVTVAAGVDLLDEMEDTSPLANEPLLASFPCAN